MILRSLLVVDTPYLYRKPFIELSFAEYRLFYRALLQKRPMILRSLILVATPYQY